MTDYGIKISIAGQDVKTATDEQMVLTSKFPFLKAYAQGSVTLTITGTGIFSTTVTHNFGYYPVFVHYAVVDPASPSERWFGRFGATGVGGSIGIDSNTTTSTLTIAWEDTSVAPGAFETYPYPVYLYYYLFYDKLA